MEPSKGSILIVDDEPDLLEVLSKILVDAGYDVHTARDGTEALTSAVRLMPDLIVLDIMIPHIDGKHVKIALSKNPKTAEIPVIFLSAKGTLEDRVEGLELEPDDYITKPFETKELMARIQIALARRRHYEQLAMTDGLTGLENFQGFKKQIEVLFNIAKRYQRPFSLAVLDIDNLKAINDTYGHQTGDSALKLVAAMMKETFRKADILIRYGGDEFVILFPESDLHQAGAAMARFKAKLAGRHLSGGRQDKVPVSISVGLAGYFEGAASGLALFNFADAQMYREKAQKKSALPPPS